VSNRRFPPPWTIEELNDACFVVRDNNGQALVYIYYEEEPGWRSAASSKAAVSFVYPCRCYAGIVHPADS
jgi:hypothetical protein